LSIEKTKNLGLRVGDIVYVVPNQYFARVMAIYRRFRGKKNAIRIHTESEQIPFNQRKHIECSSFIRLGYLDYTRTRLKKLDEKQAVLMDQEAFEMVRKISTDRINERFNRIQNMIRTKSREDKIAKDTADRLRRNAKRRTKK
jgi:hypothetical protein